MEGSNRALGLEGLNSPSRFFLQSPLKKRKSTDQSPSSPNPLFYNAENNQSMSNRKANTSSKMSINSPTVGFSKSVGLYSQDQVDSMLQQQAFTLENRLKQQESTGVARTAEFGDSGATISVRIDDLAKLVDIMKQKLEQEKRIELTIRQSLESSNQQQKQLSESLTKEQEKCRRIAEALRGVAQAHGLALPPPLQNLLTASPAIVLPPTPIPNTLFGNQDQYEAGMSWIESLVANAIPREIVTSPAASPAVAAPQTSTEVDNSEDMMTDTPEADVDAMVVDSQSATSPHGLLCEETLDYLQETIMDSSSMYHVSQVDQQQQNLANIFLSPAPKAPTPQRTMVTRHQQQQQQQQKLPSIVVTPPQATPPVTRRRQSTGKGAAVAAAIANQAPAPTAAVSAPPVPSPAPPAPQATNTVLMKAQETQSTRRIRKITPAASTPSTIASSNPMVIGQTTHSICNGATIIVNRKPSASNSGSAYRKSSLEKTNRTKTVDLFAEHLPDGVTREMLQEFFREAQVELSDFVLGANGTGFITFPSLEEAQRAHATCNKKYLSNKQIQLSLDTK